MHRFEVRLHEKAAEARAEDGLKARGGGSGGGDGPGMVPGEEVLGSELAAREEHGLGGGLWARKRGRRQIERKREREKEE